MAPHETPPECDAEPAGHVIERGRQGLHRGGLGQIDLGQVLHTDHFGPSSGHGGLHDPLPLASPAIRVDAKDEASGGRRHDGPTEQLDDPQTEPVDHGSHPPRTIHHEQKHPRARDEHRCVLGVDEVPFVGELPPERQNRQPSEIRVAERPAEKAGAAHTRGQARA